MKLKDLSWIFLLSILGIAYCITNVISKVLFEWGGLATIICMIIGFWLATFICHYILI